jgi:hypothetical protein
VRIFRVSNLWNRCETCRVHDPSPKFAPTARYRPNNMPDNSFAAFSVTLGRNRKRRHTGQRERIATAEIIMTMPGCGVVQLRSNRR